MTMSSNLLSIVHNRLSTQQTNVRFLQIFFNQNIDGDAPSYSCTDETTGKELITLIIL